MPCTTLKLDADQYRRFGNTGLNVPPIVFSTSALGNVDRTIPEQTKTAICAEWFKHVPPPVFIDTAGKAGAGLALETIGSVLNRLDISRDEVIISNKLGWKLAPSRNTNRNIELSDRKNIEGDAARSISYEGILECWEEGCRLLGGNHPPQLVSVEDPDEYLAASGTVAERNQRFGDIVGALKALGELKQNRVVKGIGIAAKDWRVVKEIDDQVRLDWVMLVGSLTILRHPPALLDYIERLAARHVPIINSGLFHSGFLVGGEYLDGRVFQSEGDAAPPLIAWRRAFVALCEAYGVSPAHACVEFGLSPPGVVAVALDTSRPDRVGRNVASVLNTIPPGFWASMKEEGLIAESYSYLG